MVRLFPAGEARRLRAFMASTPNAGPGNYARAQANRQLAERRNIARGIREGRAGLPNRFHAGTGGGSIGYPIGAASVAGRRTLAGSLEA